MTVYDSMCVCLCSKGKEGGKGLTSKRGEGEERGRKGLSETLMLNISETKRFMGSCPIGTL